ncbi:DDE-type integrase/transposase/recombinase, partial [Rhizobium ruizarguesonis]
SAKFLSPKSHGDATSCQHILYNPQAEWKPEIEPTLCDDIWKRSADKWHLNEVVINIGGKKKWLWRAVDQDGLFLDVFVQ